DIYRSESPYPRVGRRQKEESVRPEESSTDQFAERYVKLTSLLTLAKMKPDTSSYRINSLK
ncbi:MAG TPA: hypothetical protein DCY30_05340, partial [Acidimicrobiaceae bacterium]|nr:hypothetical protein [Acidimicrobiaceae bacterium]